MASFRTDLATEAAQAVSGGFLRGVSEQKEEKNGLKITRTEVTPEAETAIGKRAGKYVTLEVPSFEHAAENFSDEITALAEELRVLLPKTGTVLVAGLGNNDITPDALGPKTVDRILATRHIPDEVAAQTGLGRLRSIAAIAPGVLGQTGMETYEILASLTGRLNPAAVLVVDALAAKSVERLGKTVQITDTGISPGSGVQNSRKEISDLSLGVPVIAVGVPTVVDMATIVQELSGKQGIENPQAATMMVTPREIDVMIEKSAKMLALAINRALQPTLTLDEITALVS